MEYLPYLLTFYLAFCSALFSPGPNILAIVGTSMTVSRRAGVLLACGISTGSLVWSSLAVSGVTALMAAYAPITIALRIMGGAYLVWLGIGFARKATAPRGEVGARALAKGSALSYYLRGIAVQLTNPKAILSWLALVAIVADPAAPLWVSLAMILGCTSIAFAGHIGWAYLFSTERVVASYSRASRWIEGALATFFGAIGGTLLWDGIREARA